MKSEEEWIREHEARISRLEKGLNENVKEAIRDFLIFLKNQKFVFYRYMQPADEEAIAWAVDHFIDDWEDGETFSLVK